MYRISLKEYTLAVLIFVVVNFLGYFLIKSYIPLPYQSVSLIPLNFLFFIALSYYIVKIFKTDQPSNQATLKAKSNLVDYSTNLLWSIDSNYCLTAFNKQFATSIKRFIPNPKEGDYLLSEVFDEDTRNWWKQYYDRALAGEQFIDVSKNSENGEILYSENHFTPIITNNVVTGVSCSARDITEAKTEQRLKERSQQKVKLQKQLFDNVFENLTVALLITDYENDEVKFLNKE
ncbi:PAS domain S-box protein, partial [Fulvivirga sp. RKSG066]|uniref:PAS domain S-box protein n=1 Tax=Fulvivirga aurantia TaxID=2529383 RepID=UPI0012BCDAEB